jgi:predicted GNAT family acetyltransferase
MEHVLDNPGYNALITGNNNLAQGIGDILFFDREVSPFVGLKENSAENLRALHTAVHHTSPVCLITPVLTDLPAQWKVLHLISGVQMLYKGETAKDQPELTTLTEAHVPQMLALTKLTNPGPFATRTISFGHYRGIFDGNNLVAMAGQRLHVGNYAEISAVCTHPDYLGRGYARQLLINQVQRIQAAGETPFLHVRHDNYRAIQVYESLGFETRSEMHFYIMAKGE